MDVILHSNIILILFLFFGKNKNLDQRKLALDAIE